MSSNNNGNSILRKPFSVLIIEDDDEVRADINMTFTIEGYEKTKSFSSAESAIIALNGDFTPHVIIADSEMQSYKEYGKNGNIFTGADILTKPISNNSLVKVLFSSYPLSRFADSYDFKKSKVAYLHKSSSMNYFPLVKQADEGLSLDIISSKAKDGIPIKKLNPKTLQRVEKLKRNLAKNISAKDYSRIINKAQGYDKLIKPVLLWLEKEENKEEIISYGNEEFTLPNLALAVKNASEVGIKYVISYFQSKIETLNLLVKKQKENSLKL